MSNRRECERAGDETTRNGAGASDNDSPIKNQMLRLWRGLYAARITGADMLDDALLAICTKVPGDDAVRTRVFANLAEAAKFAMNAAAQADVYFRVGLLPPDFDTKGGTKRGDANDTVYMPGLVLDIDVGGTGHLKTRADAFQMLAALPKPGLLVSSHPDASLHAYVLLRGDDGACDTAEDRARLTLLGQRLHADARHVATTIDPAARLDGVHDPARILRVPGTLNHKYGEPVPVELLVDEDFRYTLGELEEELGPAPIGGANRAHTEDHAPVDIDAMIEAFLATHGSGSKVDRLWHGDTSDYGGDHSDADLALCSYLAQVTRNATAIDAAFRRCGLMRPKWNERRGERTYGDMTIAKALSGESWNGEWTELDAMVEPEPKATMEEDDDDPRPKGKLDELPAGAFRGVFKDYREAMAGTSEAPDSAHFAGFWAMAAARLRRRAKTFYAYLHYVNVYLVVFGLTGDSKTSAMRTALRSLLDDGGNVRVLRGLGSTEGLGDWMQAGGSGNSQLLYLEEIGSLLARGGWEGSTVLQFLAETFDAPDTFEIPYRKNPVKVIEPTPTLLAGTTSEWFWSVAKERDFHGGFGNRLFFLTGEPKDPVPHPGRPDERRLARVRQVLAGLDGIDQPEATLTPEAMERWDEFYIDWKKTSPLLDGLTAAATKRTPTYARKLALLYATLERTLPSITAEQIAAAIKVANFGFRCAKRLIHGRVEYSVQGRCERAILAALKADKLPAWKIHHQIGGGKFTAFDLERALKALTSTGAIEIVGHSGRGSEIYRARGTTRKA